MSLLALIVLLVVIGVVLWAINTYVPMNPKIKWIINAVGIIVAILLVLEAFGVLDELKGIDVPTVSMLNTERNPHG